MSVLNQDYANIEYIITDSGSIWKAVGGLYEILDYCMDYDLSCEFNQITNIYHIPFVLGAWRKHAVAP